MQMQTNATKIENTLLKGEQKKQIEKVPQNKSMSNK